MPTKNIVLSSLAGSDRFVGADFSLSKSTAITRAFSARSRDFGDPEFSSKVHLGSDDARLLRAFQESPAARAAAIAVVSMGSQYCFCSKGSLRAAKPRRGLSPYADWKARSDLLGHSLDALADALLAAEPSLREWRPEPTRGARILFFLLMASTLALGVAARIEQTSWRHAHPLTDLWAASIPWGAIVPCALAGLAFGMGCAWIAARDSSRLPTMLSYGFVCGAQAAFLLGAPLFEYANAHLPSSAPEERYPTRASYSESRGKNGPTLRIHLGEPPSEALARAGIAPDEADAESFAFMGSSDSAPPPGPVEVRIQRGALGYPVVRAISPPAAPR